MSALHEVLAKFDQPKKSGGQWLVRCPAHQDRTASLAIREGDDGKLLMFCHAGCSVETILSTLGLDESALFEEANPKRDIVATYPYTDEQGATLYEVVRFAPKDFRQRRPDGNGGYLWSLGDTRRVLYHLHDLQGKPGVLIVEGEKDAEAAWALGLPATCNLGGSGKWRGEYTQQLVSLGVKRATVVPDNDDPGRAHADTVAKSLLEAGLNVRLAILPDVPPKGDLTDYLSTHTKDTLLTLLRGAPAWTPDLTKAKAEPAEPITLFQRTPEGKFVWALNPPGVMFELDRVRRDHHELCGELTVRCDISGAGRTSDGTLMTADFNLSSARARSERAKLLAQRAKTKDEIDWMGYLEEFCEKVFAAERGGAPPIRLDEGEVVESLDDTVAVDGLRLLLRHPIILFGDGGTAKSYIGLYLAGRLAQEGQRVLYCDWELLPDEHRVRLRRLFGYQRPSLWYLTCDRPLVSEQDRLLKTIRSNGITYIIVDSVAVACDGPPEAAEVTTAYFRALRTLGVGSLNIAHTNRSEQADRKPFGSSFWHNLARATWFCQRAEETEDPRLLTIGLFNRKANLGPIQPAVSFRFEFERDRTTVSTQDVRDCPEFVGSLAMWQRIQAVLATANGPMTTAAIAAEVGAKENTINTAVRRRPGVFERTLSTDGVQRIRLVKGAADDR